MKKSEIEEMERLRGAVDRLQKENLAQHGELISLREQVKIMEGTLDRFGKIIAEALKGAGEKKA